MDPVMFSDFPDFDLAWFAQDADGALALLFTAGEGYSPTNIESCADALDAVMLAMPTPHWGTNDVFQDYADRGLFVYDWSPAQQRYVRVQTPRAAMPKTLTAAISALAVLPNWPFRFADSTDMRADTWRV